MLSKAFGQRLKATREERGMTQRELARRIETQVPQISRYENGVYLPNAETLVQIAAVLKTGIDTLLLGKELPDTGDQPLKNIVLLERLAEIDQLDFGTGQFAVGGQYVEAEIGLDADFS